MEISQITQWAFRLKHSAACRAVTVFGTISLALATNAADEPAQQRTLAVSVATKSAIDGAEIFTREWIPGDQRSHGGDGLGRCSTTVRASRAITRVELAVPDRRVRTSTS